MDDRFLGCHHQHRRTFSFSVGSQRIDLLLPVSIAMIDVFLPVRPPFCLLIPILVRTFAGIRSADKKHGPILKKEPVRILIEVLSAKVPDVK